MRGTGVASTSQDEAIAFLESPASHGPGIDRVERIDTHGAIVFLAGARAYKLKRAVRFPYMDFSTLELRRRACEAELRLNRRTAPAIYERVVAITREAHGWTFDGPGTPIDYAVAMRRFDQAMLFDRLAMDGRLTDGLMADLAEEIARFHGEAERRDDFGGADAMRWVVDINRGGFTAAGAMLDASLADEVDARCRAALAQNADLLDSRSQAGFMRRCHGDLHLRNICLFEGRPTLFDAVEFNDRISVIDTLYDFAFLVMDLEHRALRALANATFNHYLDARADYGGLAAWPLMLACRAGVRAQTGAAAARAQAGAALRDKRAGEARAYLALARDFLSPPPARLIAIAGLSGTGKSTLARALAPRIGGPPGAVVLRTDIIRKRLAGVPLTEKLPDAAYSRAATARVYDTLLATAATVAKAGHAVIADAVFLDPAERTAIEAVAVQAGVRFSAIWLDLSDDERAHRVTQRSLDASDATVEVVRRQALIDPGPIRWPSLPVAGAPQAVLEQARRLLI